MMVGLIPTIIIIIIGTTLGMISGYAGGWIDNLLMRFTDIIYAFPDLLFFIILLTALRDTWIGQLMNGLFLLFVALAIVSWTGTARLVRGQVLALKEKDFVEAARAIGASPIHIMLRHLLPNSLAPILVAATFRVPQSILLEAILGFIGVGVRPSTDQVHSSSPVGALCFWKDAMRFTHKYGCSSLRQFASPSSCLPSPSSAMVCAMRLTR